MSARGSSFVGRGADRRDVVRLRGVVTPNPPKKCCHLYVTSALPPTHYQPTRYKKWSPLHNIFFYIKLNKKLN